MPVNVKAGARALFAVVVAAASLLAVVDSRRVSGGAFEGASPLSALPVAESQPAPSSGAQPACSRMYGPAKQSAGSATAEAPLLFHLNNATLEQHLHRVATPHREIIFACASLPAGFPLQAKMVHNFMWHVHHVGRAANVMIISQHPSTCLQLVVCPQAGIQRTHIQLLAPRNIHVIVEQIYKSHYYTNGQVVTNWNS